MSQDNEADISDWPMVAFGLGLAAFAAFQLFKLPPALPELLRLYNYDLRLAAGFMSVYAVVGLLFSLALGNLIIRHGYSFMVTLGLLLMAFGSLAALFWPQAGWLVLFARAVEGLGFAVCAIAGPVIANSCAGRRHLPLVIGLTAAWIPLGQIAATLMAAGFDALNEAGSLPSLWQPLWVVAFLSALLFAFFSRRFAPRLAAAGLQEGAAGGKAVLGQRAHGNLLLAAIVFLLWAGQYFAFMTWLPQYLVESRGLPETLALGGYLLPLVILVAANVMTGALLRAGIAPGTTLLCGLLLQALSWWLMPLKGESGSAATGIGLLLFYGLGAGITPASLFAMPGAILGLGGGKPALVRGFAVIMTGRNLGIVLGPLLLAQIFSSSGYWESGKPIFGALAIGNFLLAAVLAIRLRRERD